MSPGAGVRKIWFTAFVLGAFAPRALAAFASCQSGWEWANNTMQQNPCEIAGALEATCEGYSVYELGPLGQGTNYVTPQTNSSAQKCQCNTVMYSLYMACTACQNVTTQPWGFWSQFCTEVYIAQYPEPIPANTAVPHWAFLNVTGGSSQFDPVAAKSAGGLPETLAQVPSTASIPHSSTSSGSPTPTGTSTGTKKSNVGAIVGGVIACLAVLGAAGVGVWIFFRRRATARINWDYPGYFSVPSIDHDVPPAQMRLYDPYDPSTYPTHVDYDHSGGHTSSSNKGHYTGAAEL